VTTTQTAPIAHQARRRGPGSGLLFAFGLVLALAAIGSSTMTIVGLWWLRSATTTTDLGAASTVSVRQSCGSVTIRGADVSDVQLTLKTWSTFHKPQLTTTRSTTGTLLVEVHCRSFEFGGISGTANLTLVVPRATTLDASSSGGSVHLTGETGAVTAHSSAGSVRGDSLGSATVKASSSAGSVNLSFVTAPTTVDASSSAGSVSIEVPDDGTAYAVDAHASAGSTHVGIATNPNSTRSIHATSSAGSVHVAWN
jgi:DUF4097 and DUF4098 domain-containing protein YvlB